jgi:putative thiamine transport system permease protein
VHQALLAIPLAIFFLVPLTASLALVLPAAVDGAALRAVLQHPQFWGGLALSLFTGALATGLSLTLATGVAMGGSPHLARRAGYMLAVPHLAFAIGLAFFIAPTGMLARLLALPLGWATPPAWVTVQDPSGIALIAALVLKETPFLVWAYAALLNRDDLRVNFAGQTSTARSLGHGSLSIWANVLLPQLLARMKWALLAVFAYGCTVVDMAAVIGPTQPPTLAQILWAGLNRGLPEENARAAAGSVLLSATIIFLSWVVWVIFAFLRRLQARRQFRLFGTRNWSKALSGQIWMILIAFYSFVGIFIFVATFAAQWPFPDLAPKVWSTAAWRNLLAQHTPTLNSLLLAVVSTLAAMAACLAWLESFPQRFDKLVYAACALALCLPGLLIALGQYRLFLAAGLTGTALAMFLAHVLPVTAYVFVMLADPYRALDPRWLATANGLRVSRHRSLLRVKWPLLKAPILSAAAVGFAVSIAQYVPAQLAGAGRYATLPTEAVTLASGGNRATMAVYAVALTIMPLLAFLIAAWAGRPKFRHA